MMYLSLWNREAFNSGTAADVAVKAAKSSPATMALLQGINLTVVTCDVDQLPRNYGRGLKGAADTRAPYNLPRGVVQSESSSRLDVNNRFADDRRSGDHLTSASLPSQLPRGNLQCVQKTVFASHHRKFTADRGRRRNSQPRFEFPFHRSGARVHSIKEEIFGPDEKNVSGKSRRGIDAVSCGSSPNNRSRNGIQGANTPASRPYVDCLLRGIGRGIDTPAKRLLPARVPRFRFDCVHMTVGAAEKDKTVADSRRGPDFCWSGSRPDLRTGFAIQGIDLTVVATEKDPVRAQRRCGVDLARGLKFPFYPASFHADRMQNPRNRGYIENPIPQHGSGSNRATHARLPPRAHRSR